jgi:hypothetical protein
VAIIAIAGRVGGWSGATRAQQGAPYTDQQAAAGQAANVVGQGVPQKDPWFLPPFAIKAK